MDTIMDTVVYMNRVSPILDLSRDMLFHFPIFPFIQFFKKIQKKNQNEVFRTNIKQLECKTYVLVKFNKLIETKRSPDYVSQSQSRCIKRTVLLKKKSMFKT